MFLIILIGQANVLLTILTGQANVLLTIILIHVNALLIYSPVSSQAATLDPLCIKQYRIMT